MLIAKMSLRDFSKMSLSDFPIAKMSLRDFSKMSLRVLFLSLRVFKNVT
jgi:hypothetical protein